jgi:transposase
MRITEAVKVRTPGLLEVNGVGPDSAAVLLIAAGDNPERVDSEASFAALCENQPGRGVLRQDPASQAEPRW